VSQCNQEINDHCFAEGLDVKESMTSPTERVSMQQRESMIIPKERASMQQRESMTIPKEMALM